MRESVCVRERVREHVGQINLAARHHVHCRAFQAKTPLRASQVNTPLPTTSVSLLAPCCFISRWWVLVCVCVWMGGCELCELDVALKSTARETNAHVLLSVSLSPPFSLQAKRQGRKRAKRPASASHLVLSVRFMTTLSALSPFPQVTGFSRQCYASLFEPSMPHTSTLFFPTLNPPKPLSLSFSLFLCVSLW